MLFFTINVLNVHFAPSNQISIYRNSKFVSQKQYLFSFLTYRNAKKTQTNIGTPHIFFTLSNKKWHTNLKKWHLQRSFSLVCMLVVLVMMNVFWRFCLFIFVSFLTIYRLKRNIQKRAKVKSKQAQPLREAPLK